MTASTKPKQSLVGIELVRLLAYEGDRVFTTGRARELAPRVGLNDTYVAESLYHLRRNNWIVSPAPGSLCAVFDSARGRRQPTNSRLLWPWWNRPPFLTGRPCTIMG